MILNRISHRTLNSDLFINLIYKNPHINPNFTKKQIFLFLANLVKIVISRIQKIVLSFYNTLQSFNILLNMKTNNILSIFTGQQPQYLAYHFYHLQAQQIFDTHQSNPEIDQKVIWKDLEKHLPRCLIYGLKGDIKLLEHQNRSNNKKIIAKLEGQSLGIPLVGDIQSEINMRLKGMKNKVEQPQEEDKEWKQIFNNFDIPQKQLIQSGKYSTKKQWESFYGGKNITKREDEMDRIIQPLRKQLQQQDYMEGFVMFGEIYNGFGSISQTIITQLHNHCPKAPLIFSGILQPSQKPTQAQDLNKLIAYSQFLPICDIFLPINISSQQFPYFREVENLQYRSMSPLVSNLYYPFMTGHSFGQYIKNITQYRHNNLFNMCYTVPLIQQQVLQKQYSVLRYLSHNNKLNYVRSTHQYLSSYKPSFRSYSQTYVLKGSFNLETHSIPKGSYIDFKMTDIIFSQKDQLKFSEQYHQIYGQNVTAFPFHTAMFSHECLKGEIMNVATTLKRIQPVVMQRYISQGVEKDELKEMSSQMLTFYDNYDSKGNDYEDD